MRHTSRGLALALTVALAAGAASLPAGCGRGPSHAGAGEAGAKAGAAGMKGEPGLPDVVDGKELKELLEGLRDKVVVVNVWASWCQPCLAEFPELDAFALDARKRGIEVVAISVDDVASRETAVKGFLAALKPSFRVLERAAGPENPIKIAVDEHWDGTVPTTFVLDKRGLVRATLKGPQKRTDLENAVAAVTGERPPTPPPAPAGAQASPK